MSNGGDFPTVATIIGCPEQLSSANGLVATPISMTGEIQPPPAAAIQDDISSIKDPIHRALLENICGKLATTKQVETIKCEVCNCECNGNTSYKVHLAGSRHAKKLKELEVQSFAKLPFIVEDKVAKTFICTFCDAMLNAVSQIEAHIEGAKHKSKAKAHNEEGREANSLTPHVDPLQCTLCNIHVNSKLQLAQHTTSQKHINKLSGKTPRFHPYTTKNPKSKNMNAADMAQNYRKRWVSSSQPQDMPFLFRRRKTGEDLQPQINENNELRW